MRLGRAEGAAVRDNPTLGSGEPKVQGLRTADLAADAITNSGGTALGSQEPKAREPRWDGLGSPEPKPQGPHSGLEKPAAAERAQEGRRLGAEVTNSGALGSPEPKAQGPRTADLAADAVGMSRVTYQRASYVIDTADDKSAPEPVRAAAQAAREATDTHQESVKGAVRRVNEARGYPEEFSDVVTGDQVDRVAEVSGRRPR